MNFDPTLSLLCGGLLVAAFFYFRAASRRLDEASDLEHRAWEHANVDAPPQPASPTQTIIDLLHRSMEVQSQTIASQRTSLADLESSRQIQSETIRANTALRDAMRSLRNSMLRSRLGTAPAATWGDMSDRLPRGLPTMAEMEASQGQDTDATAGGMEGSPEAEPTLERPGAPVFGPANFASASTEQLREAMAAAHRGALLPITTELSRARGPNRGGDGFGVSPDSGQDEAPTRFGVSPDSGQDEAPTASPRRDRIQQTVEQWAASRGRMASREAVPGEVTGLVSTGGYELQTTEFAQWAASRERMASREAVPGEVTGLVSTGGYELQTTEFTDNNTYPPESSDLAQQDQLTVDSSRRRNEADAALRTLITYCSTIDDRSTPQAVVPPNSSAVSSALAEVDAGLQAVIPVLRDIGINIVYADHAPVSGVVSWLLLSRYRAALIGRLPGPLFSRLTNIDHGEGEASVRYADRELARWLVHHISGQRRNQLTSSLHDIIIYMRHPDHRQDVATRPESIFSQQVVNMFTAHEGLAAQVRAVLGRLGLPTPVRRVFLGNLVGILAESRFWPLIRDSVDESHRHLQILDLTVRTASLDDAEIRLRTWLAWHYNSFGPDAASDLPALTRVASTAPGSGDMPARVTVRNDIGVWVDQLIDADFNRLGDALLRDQRNGRPARSVICDTLELFHDSLQSGTFAVSDLHRFVRVVDVLRELSGRDELWTMPASLLTWIDVVGPSLETAVASASAGSTTAGRDLSYIVYDGPPEEVATLEARMAASVAEGSLPARDSMGLTYEDRDRILREGFNTDTLIGSNMIVTNHRALPDGMENVTFQLVAPENMPGVSLSPADPNYYFVHTGPPDAVEGEMPEGGHPPDPAPVQSSEEAPTERIRGIRANSVTFSIDTQETSSEIAAGVANGFGPIPEPTVRNQRISRNPLADVASSLVERVMGAYTLARNRNKDVDTDLMTDIILAVQPLLTQARRNPRAVNRSFVEHLGLRVEANPSPLGAAIDEIQHIRQHVQSRGVATLGTVLGIPILSTDEEMANERGVAISWVLAMRALGIEYQQRSSAPVTQGAMTTWERSLDL